MSFCLLIAYFHCPITSSVTSIISQNGQLYLQLAILVLFVSMFLQTPATVHFMLLPPIWQQKGGVSTLEILTNFFLSVMAGVISYYICKWLNGR